MDLLIKTSASLTIGES